MRILRISSVPERSVCVSSVCVSVEARARIASKTAVRTALSLHRQFASSVSIVSFHRQFPSHLKLEFEEED